MWIIVGTICGFLLGIIVGIIVQFAISEHVTNKQWRESIKDKDKERRDE